MNMETTNKRIRQILYAVVILIPFIIIPTNPFADYFYHPKVIAITMITCFILIILLKNMKQVGQLIVWDEINIALLVYFVLLTVSLLFAIDIKLAMNGSPYREEGYSMLIMYMLLFLTARAACNLDERFYKGILIAACILSVYGILQYYGIDPIPRDYIRTGWLTAFATFGNPNFMGGYLVLMIPFSMHLYIIKKSKLGCIAFSIIILCLLCTMTRGAWLGGIAAVATYLFVLWFSKERYEGTIKRVTVIIVIAIIIIIGFNFQSGNVLIERFRTIFSNSKDIISGGAESDIAEHAGSGRFFIWKRVIELIAMKPWFGYGISNLQIPFKEFFQEDMIKVFGYFAVLDKAHNEYLNIAVSSGIPSLIAYLGFVLLTLRKGLVRIKKEPFTWPLMAAVLAYLTQALFNVSVVSVAYIFWVLLGLLAGRKKESTVQY